MNKAEVLKKEILRQYRSVRQFAIEMVTLENGGIVKSIHGSLYKNSIWYSVYGSKGRMESAREDAKEGHVKKLYVNCDEFSGEYGKEKIESYMPENEVKADVKGFGHGGSDFYSMYHFAFFAAAVYQY